MSPGESGGILLVGTLRTKAVSVTLIVPGPACFSVFMHPTRVTVRIKVDGRHAQ